MAYNNGNSYDQEAEYAKKSMTELINTLQPALNTFGIK